MRASKPLNRLVVILAAFFTPVLLGIDETFAQAITPGAINQPAGQNSVLIPFNFNVAGGLKEPNVIYDSTLATWAQNTLTIFNNANKQVPDVGSATFLFQQCYGGGFLDDLNNTLSPLAVPWVGGSAARYDQAAYGQFKGNPPMNPPADSPVGDPPINYWTNELFPTLVGGTNIAGDINTANANDPVGTFLAPPPKTSETGQLFFANGGQNITLDNNANVSHYAILFAGYTDAQRHYTSMTQIYSQLVNAWAGSTYQITVLYGNAANQVPYANAEQNLAGLNGFNAANTTIMQATYNNLQAAFGVDQGAIATDYGKGKTNDQFVFYAGDHGGNTQIFGGGVGGGGPVGTMTTPLPTFSITKDDLSAIGEDPIDVPTLTFDFTTTDPSSDVEVLLNGNPIGALESSTTGANSATFDVPDSDFVAGTDSLSLETLGGPQMTINDYSLFTGAVDDGPISVPEPAGATVMICFTLAVTRRRRSSRASLNFV